MQNYERVQLWEGERPRNHYYYEPDKAIFYKNRTKSNALYLNCFDRRCKCRAKLVGTTFTRTNPRVQHHHVDHSRVFEYDLAFSRLRRLVAADRRCIRELHSMALRPLSAAAAARMAWSTVNKTLRRIRHAQQPLCGSLAELTILLEARDSSVFHEYGRLRDIDFYRGTIGGCLVFANMEIVSHLDANFEICCDATFGILPFETRQLFVIMGDVRGRPRPIVFAIMPSQTEDDYIAVLTLVRDGILSFDGHRRVPVAAISDFEMALRNALIFIWPQIHLTGCNFHLCQALRRKALTCDGLGSKLRGRSEHHTVLKMFMRLSLLPLPRVEAGLEALIAAVNQNPRISGDFAPFIAYFQRTWLVRYPIEGWVVGDRARRTNNSLEGFNHQIKLTIPSRPSVYVFLDGLMDLAHNASADVHKDIMLASPPPVDRSLISVPLSQALHQLQSGEIDVLHFLHLLA
jgi:hypothetical protein